MLADVSGAGRLAGIFALTIPLFAQPVLTSWRINTTAETGTYHLQNGTTGTLLANVQQVQYDNAYAYISASGIPSYDIGPWGPNPNVPRQQNYVVAIPRQPVDATTPVRTPPGANGLFVNGVAIYNAWDTFSWSNATHSETPQGDGVWNRNGGVVEAPGFDPCDGHPQQQGAYHHHEYPACLGKQLGATSTQHSPILGFAFDGYPIYGPWGFDPSGVVRRMESSFRLRVITQRHSLPNGQALQPNQYGPDVSSQFPLGRYLEDYEFVPGLGDLDEHDGHFCITPDYPTGTYAYFLPIDAGGEPEFPYTIGMTFKGSPYTADFGQSRINLPSGLTQLRVLTITTFSPDRGTGSSRVVITGKGFLDVTTVFFGDVSAPFIVDSDTQITATIPSNAKSGRIRADRADAYVRSTTDFSVIAGKRRRASR